MATRPVWVVAERDHRGLRETSLEILGEGRRLADELKGILCCVLIGDQLGGFVEVCGRYGADAVYIIEHPLLARYTTDGYTNALADLIRHHAPFLMILSATPNGQDLAPRVAARLKVGLVTDCVTLKLDEQSRLQFVKPTHEDKVYATLTCRPTVPLMATLRPGAVGPSPATFYRQPEVIRWEIRIEPSMLRTRSVGMVKGNPKRIDLTEAEIIVAGGRGVGGAQAWHIVERLAELLRASVGGTRMAMDMGWISRDRMIGQTGKSVGPKLYLAVGIAGASQHVDGIEADFIVAINKDRNAPIFRRSELGIIGDLHEILPLLVRRVEQLKANNP